MKNYLLCTTFFLIICFVNGSAQTGALKANAEYDVLDAWAGTWIVQGEARDSMSGPGYPVDWTLKGKRILNGFALQISHQWKAKNSTQHGFEITGYDPIKKSCMTHIFYDDGSWLNSTPEFTDKRTCIENGATYYPDGKVDIWRYTWHFSEDWMSFAVTGENLKDNVWWKAFAGKGVKKN